MVKGQKWMLVKPFDGVPNEENIQLVDFELPPLKDGQILLQSIYMTVDPYMKGTSTVGAPMVGQSLAEVLESKNAKYSVGTLLIGYSGWVTHYISDCSDQSNFQKGQAITDNVLVKPVGFDLGKTKISYTLGTLGMPGATAYFGLDKCTPKKGETLFVSSAAGAVGHVVGQLAKIKGLTVIGSASTPEKIAWLKELGFDHVINYKTQDVFAELSRVAPEGLDIYFDNVGGDHYHNIINHHMKKYGRVLCCGSIQNYTAVKGGQPPQYAATNFSILGKELTVYGIMAPTFGSQWTTAFKEIKGYIDAGQLKTRETEYVGFDKMRDAFLAIFASASIGKQVIKCVNEKTAFP